MDYRALGKTGLRLSALGFGASPFGGAFGKVSERDAAQAVNTAVELGINYFDVAPYYGNTLAESILGKALRTIPRDAYHLSTKVGRYGKTAFDFSPKRVALSVDESLDRLKVDYIDMIICHDIEFVALDQVIDEALPALRRLRTAGKVGYIGIAGLPLKIFRYVVERTEIDFILSYCHYSLHDTALVDLVPALKANGIGIISASPLAMGLLTERGAPEWHPASPRVKALCAEAARHCRSRGADIARLALQFSLAQSDFASTLVGISQASEIAANVQRLTETIDQALLDEVLSILRPVHNVSWMSGRPENNDRVEP